VLFSEDARKRVISALRSGLSIAVAASLVGISREAVRRRRRQDAQFDGVSVKAAFPMRMASAWSSMAVTP
jgi:transposase